MADEDCYPVDFEHDAKEGSMCYLRNTNQTERTKDVKMKTGEEDQENLEDKLLPRNEASDTRRNQSLIRQNLAREDLL